MTKRELALGIMAAERGTTPADIAERVETDRNLKRVLWHTTTGVTNLKADLQRRYDALVQPAPAQAAQLPAPDHGRRYHVRIVGANGEGCILSVRNVTDWKTIRTAQKHMHHVLKNAASFGADHVEIKDNTGAVVQTWYPADDAPSAPAQPADAEPAGDVYLCEEPGTIAPMLRDYLRRLDDDLDRMNKDDYEHYTDADRAAVANKAGAVRNVIFKLKGV